MTAFPIAPAGRSWKLLCAILLVGVGVRVGIVLSLKTHRGGAGAYEHAAIARSLAAGEGFRYRFFSSQPHPTSHQAPGVPFVLSLCYRALGPGSAKANLAYLMFNVFLGVIAILAVYWLSSTMWRDTVGIWAAACFALYPPLAYDVTRIQAVNWSVSMLLATAALVVATRKNRSPRLAALAGLTAGVGILGEPILLAPFGAAWLAMMAGTCRRGFKDKRKVRLAGVAALLVAAGCVGPWLVRNYVVHRRIALVKSSFWYVFWQGNQLQASGTDKLEVSQELQERLAWKAGLAGLEKEIAAARRQAASVDTTLTRTQLAEIASRSTEARRMEWFRDAALDVLAGHPWHYVRMCGRRLGQILWFDPTNPRSFLLAYRLSYLGLCALAVVGLCLAVRDRPVLASTPALMLLGLVTVHVTVITSARFRLPIEALYVLPASVALATLGGKVAKILRK